MGLVIHAVCSVAVEPCLAITATSNSFAKSVVIVPVVLVTELPVAISMGMSDAINLPLYSSTITQVLTADAVVTTIVADTSVTGTNAM